MDIVFKINATVLIIIVVMVLIDSFMEWNYYTRPDSVAVICGVLVMQQALMWPIWVIMLIWGVL